MDAYMMSREAFDARGPYSKYLDAGRTYAGAAPWYDTRKIYQAAADELGPEEAAQRVNSLLGGFRPASTARSAPPSNLRRAFLWQNAADAGLVTPEILRTHKVEVAPGMGHFAQTTAHQPALARFLETGRVDPVINPKPASFGANETGNWEPGTFDTVMSRIADELEPGLKPFFDIKPGGDVSPKGWAYEPLERGLADAAHEYHASGLLDVPDGLAPVAPYQSLGWHGKTRSAEYGSMNDIFEAIRKEAAKRWGVSEAEANRLIWRDRQTPLVPIGAPLITGLTPR
jgi:hypothetical protein